MDLLLRMVDISAVVLGAVVLAVPIAMAVANSSRGRGRSTGGGRAVAQWPLATLATAVLVGMGILLWVPIPGSPSGVFAVRLTISGAVLYFPGISLYVWSLLTLGSEFGVSSAFGAGLYPNHRLIRRGPFGMVRHPMYLGVILTAWGALLIFRTAAMLVFAPMSIVVIFRARQEEKVLSAEFRETWVEYSERVPKWLPRISSKKHPKSRRPA
jgi:protein-S-isoprenylcysteine O-methyltransferase